MKTQLGEIEGSGYHGRLSSASTGRLAALRLPLAVLVAANIMSLEAGTSMSISSSKSDMVVELGCVSGVEAVMVRYQAQGLART